MPRNTAREEVHMTKERALEFEKLLREDEELQRKLYAAMRDFDGDAADVRAVFEGVVAPLATEAGFDITYDDALAVLEERELSDDEMKAVAGGAGVCYVIGGSDEPEAHCERVEGFACAYVGVTWGNKHA